MNDYNVMLSIQYLSIVLFIGLPFLARLIWKEYSAIPFVLLLVIFWLISSLVAIITIATFTRGWGLGLWFYQKSYTTNFHHILGRETSILMLSISAGGNKIMRNGKTPRRFTLKTRLLWDGCLSRNRNTTRKTNLFVGLKRNHDFFVV